MQQLQSIFDPTSPIHTPTQTNDGISQTDHDTGKLIPAILFEKHHGDEMGIGWGRGLPTAT